MNRLLDPEVVIAKIQNTKEIGKRWSLAGSYYKSLNKCNYPVIKNDHLYLFYWDEVGKATVHFVSEINNWNSEQSALKRIAATPLMYIKLPLNYNTSFKYLFSLPGRLFLDSKNGDVSSRYFGRAVSVFDPIRKKYPAWMWNDRNNVGGHVKFSRLPIDDKNAITLMHYYHSRSSCNSVVFVIGEFKRSERVLLKNIISNLYTKFGFPPIRLVLIGFGEKNDNATVFKLLSTSMSPQLCEGKKNDNKIIYKYLIVSQEVAFDLLKFSLRKKVDFKKVLLFDLKFPANQRRFRYALRRIAKNWFHPSFLFSLKEKGADVSYLIKKMKSKSAKVDVTSYPEVDSRFARLSLFKAQLEQLFFGLNK